MHPTEITVPFEKASSKISDDLTELVKEMGTENLQRIVSLSVVMISSANYLAIRASKQPVFYGLDLSSNASWHHIEGILADMIDAYWGRSEANSE